MTNPEIEKRMGEVELGIVKILQLHMLVVLAFKDGEIGTDELNLYLDYIESLFLSLPIPIGGGVCPCQNEKSKVWIKEGKVIRCPTCKGTGRLPEKTLKEIIEEALNDAG